MSFPRRVRYRPTPGLKPIPYVSFQRRVMVCLNEFWTASATWVRKAGIWACETADDRLKWMKRKDPASAKLELARLGCKWEWKDLIYD